MSDLVPAPSAETGSESRGKVAGAQVLLVQDPAVTNVPAGHS